MSRKNNSTEVDVEVNNVNQNENSTDKNIDNSIETSISKTEMRKKRREATSDIELSEEIVNEKMRQAIEFQKSKNRKKTAIWSLVLLIINIVFMIFIVQKLLDDVEDFNINSLFSKQGNKLWWLVVGLVVYAIFIFVQVVFYKILIQKLSGKKSWKTSYDVAVVGKYYDNVTPFAMGGQPMQIITLAKRKISAGVATGIPIIKMIINTTVTAILALLFFIMGLPMLSATTPLNQILMVLLEIFGVVGLIITVLIAIFMFLLSSGTLFTRSLIRSIIRFLYKIKIVKDYRKSFRKVLNQVAEYKFSMRYLWNNKKLLFSLLGLNIVEVICLSLFPFIVVMALGNITENWILVMFLCMVKYYLCQMASSFIPLPGGTGLMEISYIILFGMILGDNIVWGLLIWRFMSYYIILIHGFVHELIKIIKNFVRTKKSKDGEVENLEIFNSANNVENDIADTGEM